MTVTQVDALLMMFFLAIGLVVGYAYCEAGYRKREGKRVQSELKDIHDRRQLKLSTTKRNIAGRIRRAVEDCIPANHQWGARLILQGEESGNLFSIYLKDRVESLMSPVLLIHVSQDVLRGKVRVHSETYVNGTLEDIFLSGPNDPELTQRISDLLDQVREWQPKVSIMGRRTPILDS